MNMSMHKLVETIKENSEDYEFYPTTHAMLDVIKTDIRKKLYIHDDQTINCSILDVGAGTGSALEYLTDGPRYAIEKSKTLISQMDKSVIIVGTDFESQTLVDKKTTVLFQNPPYSQYDSWMSRTIREANSRILYFVVPQRWKNNESIKQALELRDGEVEVLASMDFLDAPRAARAVVDIVRVNLDYSGHGYNSSALKTDPFEIWFKTHFNIKATKKADYTRVEPTSIREKIEKKGELVNGTGLVDTLVELYNHDMNGLMSNYLKVAELDAELLDELNVSVDGVLQALKQKIENLKYRYWKELFDNLTVITSKLTSDSRAKMLKMFMENTSVDFTKDNAHSVVIWCLKHANSYFDEQLVSNVQFMVGEANVSLYKSNEKMFGREFWSYHNAKYQLEKFKLEHRVVITGTGGVQSGYQARKGLAIRCYDFISDLVVLAGNVGLDTSETESLNEMPSSASGQKMAFHFKNHLTGKQETLFEFKPFKNSNIHVKFHPEFILRLNVEMGRLKGWVKSKQEAAQELDVDVESIAHLYNCNVQLGANNIRLLQAA